MGNIAILPNDVIDKIAAGEVVQNPASVVKELVENSLDAQAECVIVEVKEGGLQMIRVDDDGIGMEEDDAILSLKRHATSKIFSAEDLFSISTMGFRGEALSSIAAVSKLTLKTCFLSGIAIHVEGGVIVSKEVVAKERGTSIEVRSLFYNTPARRHFQKSSAANLAEIIRLMTALSLGYPDRQFELRSQGKNILKTWKVDCIEQEALLGYRIQSVLGETFYSQSTYFFEEKGEYQIYGYLGDPNFVKQNRLGQYLFFNQRWVQSPYINQIVKEMYGTHVKEGSFPYFVLHVRLPQDHIDVNIHPQKREVRLKEKALIKNLLIRAFQKVIGAANSPMLSSTSFSTPTSITLKTQPAAYTYNQAVQETLWNAPAVPPRAFEILALVGKFLLSKEIDGVTLWDLQRIYATRLYKQLQNEVAKEEIQNLLIPITVTVSKEKVLSFEEVSPILQTLGLQVRVIGKDLLAIDGYPSVLREVDVVLFLLDLLEGKASGLFSARNRGLAQFCTRFARQTKDFLKEEGERLLESFLADQIALFCPLGKPLAKLITEKDLDKILEEL